MKTKSTVKQIFTLTVTLLLITAGVAAALAGVNMLTKDKIAKINAEKTTNAIRAVLGDEADKAVERTDLAGKNENVLGVWETDNSYALKVVTAGFGGDVVMMVGVSKDGTVLGIDIISHAETAGLGDVAASKSAKGESFRSQFKGASGALAVNKDGGEIIPITSATITSRAVTAGVNTALEFVKTLG